jgi:hypothetical protein
MATVNFIFNLYKFQNFGVVGGIVWSVVVLVRYMAGGDDEIGRS